MSHDVETMMYAGETPWHGLGTKVLGLQTAKEAIVAAGLDWQVVLRDVYLGGAVKIPDKKAIVRETDGRVYAVVGERYTPIQNETAFNFFDALVGEGQLIYETTGSLSQGARIWILAKLPDSISVKGEQIDKYLTLVNSHNGTSALSMFFTPIRVVCANTLAQAQARGSSERFYARHTTSIMQRVAEAREVLGISNKFYTDWKEKAEWLATHQLPAGMVAPLFLRTYGYPSTVTMDDVRESIRSQMSRIEELVEVGRGMDNPSIKGTRWQYYNAVTEYIDHEKTYNKNTERLNAAWFGSGATMKRRAWDFLMKE